VLAVGRAAHCRSVSGVLSLYSLLRKMPDQVAEKGLRYKHRSSLRKSSSVSLVLLVSPQTAMPKESMHLKQRSRAMRTVDPHCGHTTGSSCRYIETEMLFIRNTQVNRRKKGRRRSSKNRASPCAYSGYLPPVVLLRKVCGEVSESIQNANLT
jgi:hypothetical protein